VTAKGGENSRDNVGNCKCYPFTPLTPELLQCQETFTQLLNLKLVVLIRESKMQEDYHYFQNIFKKNTYLSLISPITVMILDQDQSSNGTISAFVMVMVMMMIIIIIIL
jgi:hypothetical protein